MTATNLADAIEVEERTGSDGHYVNTIGPDGTIRRLPLVAPNALDAGEVLLGDSGIGAGLRVRQGISATVGQEQDDTDEEHGHGARRRALTPLVAVPAAFAHFTIPAAPSRWPWVAGAENVLRCAPLSARRLRRAR